MYHPTDVERVIFLRGCVAGVEVAAAGVGCGGFCKCQTKAWMVGCFSGIVLFQWHTSFWFVGCPSLKVCIFLPGLHRRVARGSSCYSVCWGTGFMMEAQLCGFAFDQLLWDSYLFEIDNGEHFFPQWASAVQVSRQFWVCRAALEWSDSNQLYGVIGGACDAPP